MHLEPTVFAAARVIVIRDLRRRFDLGSSDIHEEGAGVLVALVIDSHGRLLRARYRIMTNPLRVKFRGLRCPKAGG